MFLQAVRIIVSTIILEKTARLCSSIPWLLGMELLTLNNAMYNLTG